MKKTKPKEVNRRHRKISKSDHFCAQPSNSHLASRQWNSDTNRNEDALTGNEVGSSDPHDKKSTQDSQRVLGDAAKEVLRRFDEIEDAMDVDKPKGEDDETRLAQDQADKLKGLASKIERFVEGQGTLEGAVFEE